MKRLPPPPQQKRFLPLLLVLLLLGAASSFLALAMWPQAPKKAPASVSAHSEQAEALVNKHLFMASQQQYLRGKKAAAENSYLAPQLGDSIWPKIAKKKDLGVDHSPDTNEQNAYDDLNRYRKELHYTNPDQIIQGEIVDQDLQRQADADARRAYVEQFLENARRNGYAVRLDENFVVVGVSKVRERMPNNERLFDSNGVPLPSGGGGAQ